MFEKADFQPPEDEIFSRLHKTTAFDGSSHTYRPSRFGIQRKRSITTQSLQTFYGTWRAGIYFGNDPFPKPLIRFRGEFYVIPLWLMWIFRPFNTYTHTARGEYFIKRKRETL